MHLLVNLNIFFYCLCFFISRMVLYQVYLGLPIIVTVVVSVLCIFVYNQLLFVSSFLNLFSYYSEIFSAYRVKPKHQYTFLRENFFKCLVTHLP